MDYVKKAKEIFDFGAYYHEEHSHPEGVHNEEVAYADNLLLHPLAYTDFHEYRAGWIADDAIVLPFPQIMSSIKMPAQLIRRPPPPRLDSAGKPWYIKSRQLKMLVRE